VGLHAVGLVVQLLALDLELLFADVQATWGVEPMRELHMNQDRVFALTPHEDWQGAVIRKDVTLKPF
jgi:hypothetical protein